MNIEAYFCSLCGGWRDVVAGEVACGGENQQFYVCEECAVKIAEALRERRQAGTGGEGSACPSSAP